MHAILGHAASDFVVSGNSPFVAAAAVEHRCSAVTHVRKRLPALTVDMNPNESNALLPTSYLLTRQSIHRLDGLPDYMDFMRGIRTIAEAME